VNNYNLQALLGSKVLELNFVRRHPKFGWSNVRGLFGTTNPKLLNSEFGQRVLHFIPPKGVGMGYDYKSKGLCVAWDLFRQEYRVFGAEQVVIKQQWDLKTDEQITEFENYMYQYILTMSNEDKIDFMGYIGTTASNMPVQKPLTINKSESSSNKIPVKSPSISNVLKTKFDNFYKRVGDYFSGKKKK
jgi:hypothetical protein